MLGTELETAACAPARPSPRLTSSVVAAEVSRKSTSIAPLTSFATRSLADVSNAIRVPDASIDGRSEPPLPEMPFAPAVLLTSDVDAAAMSRTNTSRRPPLTSTPATRFVAMLENAIRLPSALIAGATLPSSAVAFPAA